MISSNQTSMNGLPNSSYTVQASLSWQAYKNQTADTSTFDLATSPTATFLDEIWPGNSTITNATSDYGINDTVPGLDGGPSADHEADSWAAQGTMQKIYLSIGSLGILGNLVVAFVILKTASMRSKAMHRFIVNQSFIDLTAAAFMVAYNLTEDLVVAPIGLLGELYCRVWAPRTGQWGIFLVSSWNLVFLTFERYFAICHTLTHNRSFTRNKAMVLMILAWVLGISVNLSINIPTSYINEHRRCMILRRWPNIDTQKAVAIIGPILNFFIPLLFIIYAYGHIAWALHKKRGDNMEASCNRDVQLAKAKMNTIKTLVIVAACFVFCWSWNQVYFIYSLVSVGNTESFTSDFYHFTVVMVCLNVCTNPIIYVFNFRQFQEAAKRIFCKCWVTKDKAGITISSSTYSTNAGRGASYVEKQGVSSPGENMNEQETGVWATNL